MNVTLTASGRLRLDLSGHHVTVPADGAGMRVLVKLLRDRESNPAPRIAERGALTQAQVDEILRTFTPKAAPDLADLALDLSELDL